MTQDPSLQAIAEMQKHLRDIITPLSAGADRYALLDFPNHGNVGDSAIYAGELILLDEIFGAPATYVCDYYSHFGDVDAHIGDGVIFLHGGGNFGDIWPRHQLLREEIIARYPDHRIVQLPQSLHFSDTDARDRCARIIAAHPDFTLLVRDRPSLEYAQAHFDCKVALCPDSAYMLGRVSGDDPVAHKALSLFRSDKESLDDPEKAHFSQYGPVVDWLDEVPPVRFTDRLIGRLQRVSPMLRGPLMPYKERFYRRRAWIRIRRGLDLLGTADSIVTDRLHAHILSTLLGKPHIVIDNFYGKIQNFIDAWPDDGLTRRAGSFGEARQMLEADPPVS